MHIVATRGRPLLMQRYFDEGKPEQPGVVVIDLDQTEMYAGLRLPANWSLLTAKPMLGAVAKTNLAFKYFPFAEWYSWSGDDMVARTPHWDTDLAHEAVMHGIAWGNDLIGGRCTHPFIHGDFCRDMGWVMHPDFKHLYVDTVWEELAAQLGIGKYREDIITEAHHFCNGKLPFDQTARERMEEGDGVAWVALRESGRLRAYAKKLLVRHESWCR